MLWQIDAIVGLVIAGSALTIVFLVGRTLARTRRFGANKLALATVLILFAVGIGHLASSVALLGAGPDSIALRANASPIVFGFNVVTAFAAVGLLAMRDQFGMLLSVSVTPAELELRRAIQNGELLLEYQPHIALKTGRVEGFEALVRWHHPKRGLLPPADFIPLAERTGLIHGLGRFVLREACAAAVGWEGGASGAFVAVNLSAPELSDGSLVSSVGEALAATGLPPDRLVLEVTESRIVESDGAAPAVLAELRSIGVRVALDDFGTGYSALAMLGALPVDVIKIARPFVLDLERPGTEAVVGSLIELAGKLKLGTVVEGIETRAQAETLERLGCELGQGYLFGRPMSAEAAAALLGAGAPLLPVVRR